MPERLELSIGDMNLLFSLRLFIRHALVYSPCNFPL